MKFSVEDIKHLVPEMKILDLSVINGEIYLLNLLATTRTQLEMAVEALKFYTDARGLEGDEIGDRATEALAKIKELAANASKESGA
jgi:hypothetical protein